MPAHVVRDPGIKKHDEKQKTADASLERGDIKTAIKLSRENLAWSEKTLGLTDEVTLADRDSVAFALHENGLYQEAVVLDEETLKIRRKEQGLEDPETLETQHNLALNLYNIGRYQEAANLDRRTLKAREKRNGHRDLDTLSSRHNLAASLQELKQYEEAETLNRGILSIRQRHCGQNDPDLISSRHNLAANLYGLRRYEQAAALLQENLDVLRKTQDKDDRQLAKSEILFDLNDKEQYQKFEERRTEMRKIEEKRKREIRAEEKKAEEKRIEEQRAEAKRAEKKQVEKKRAEEKKAEEKKIEENKKKIEGKNTRDLAEATKAREDTKEAATGTEQGQRRKKDSEARTEARKEDQVVAERIGARDTTASDNTKGNSSSARPDHSDQAATAKKGSLPFRHVNPQDVSANQGSTQERGPSTKDPTLSPPPDKKQQRRRAKSDQDLGKSSSRITGLVVPTDKPERPASVGPGVDESVQRKSDQPRRRSLEIPTAPNMVNALSEFYDAHIGDNNPYVMNAADKWFGFLESNTQALFEPHRRDRMRRVKIAILDTGIDRTHAGIEAQWSKRVRNVKSWVDDGGGEVDHCGHGTHGAALLMRIAPEAHLYVARIAKDHVSPISPDSVAKAIMHATDEWKVDIISMSFGFHRRYPSIEKAINHAWLKDVIIFAAASNDGANRKIAFPASMSSGVICVNSADGGGARSRYNPPAQETRHNFSVLGEAVSSAWPTKPGKAAEKRQWGTSTSTPIAAAIAALVLEFEKQPQLDISHRSRLKSLEGMREIFTHMSEAKDGYSFIVPWNLLHKRFSRERVAGRISDVMEDKFGVEDEAK